MYAYRASAAQLARFAAETLGQTYGLTARRQPRFAAAHLNDPMVVFGKNFIQSGSERVFHARHDAPGPHKGAISNGRVRVRGA